MVESTVRRADEGTGDRGRGNCARVPSDATNLQEGCCVNCRLGLSDGCQEDAALRRLVANWHLLLLPSGPRSWSWCGVGESRDAGRRHDELNPCGETQARSLPS